MAGVDRGSKRRTGGELTRGWILLWAALTGLLFAACGGQQAPSRGAPPSSGPGSAALTATEATAVAGRINLKAADLPGFFGSPHTQTPEDRQLALEMAQCAGSTPPSAASADVYSEDFSQGSGVQITAVFSHVTALPSVSMAEADLVAMRSARTLDCIKQSVARQAPGQVRESGGANGQLTDFKIRSLPVSVSGTDGGFGYRFTFGASTQAAPYTVNEDALGFVDRNVEVALAAVAIGKSFPSAIEQHLLSILVARARAAIH